MINDKELLLLDTLVYYAELSDKKLTNDKVFNIQEFIDKINEDKDYYKTVFNEVLFKYTDKDLGMHKS